MNLKIHLIIFLTLVLRTNVLTFCFPSCRYMLYITMYTRRSCSQDNRVIQHIIVINGNRRDTSSTWHSAIFSHTLAHSYSHKNIHTYTLALTNTHKRTHTHSPARPTMRACTPNRVCIFVICSSCSMQISCCCFGCCCSALRRRPVKALTRDPTETISLLCCRRVRRAVRDR